MVTAAQAVATAHRMLGNPYWYAASGQKPTEQFLNSLITGQFRAKWTPARIAKARSEVGRFNHCFDCVGLMRFVCNMQNNRDALFTNADKLRTLSSPQSISTLPEIPGVMVFMPGHVGVYIGGGRVIEAWGFQRVDNKPLSFQRWTHWGFCPWIDYGVTAQNARPTTPQPANPTTNNTGEFWNYTMKPGDTLWALASRHLGSGTRWPELAKLNGIKDERRIPVGRVIKIPGVKK